MMNLLMLRGMIASTYRPIVLPYRWFDLRRCDLRHRLAHFSARLIGWGSDGSVRQELAQKLTVHALLLPAGWQISAATGQLARALRPLVVSCPAGRKAEAPLI